VVRRQVRRELHVAGRRQFARLLPQNNVRARRAPDVEPHVLVLAQL
jgi:hypothetical protein